MSGKFFKGVSDSESESSESEQEELAPKAAVPATTYVLDLLNRSFSN